MAEDSEETTKEENVEAGVANTNNKGKPELDEEVRSQYWSGAVGSVSVLHNIQRVYFSEIVTLVKSCSIEHIKVARIFTIGRTRCKCRKEQDISCRHFSSAEHKLGFVV